MNVPVEEREEGRAEEEDWERLPEKQVFKWPLGVGRIPIRGRAGKDTPQAEASAWCVFWPIFVWGSHL